MKKNIPFILLIVLSAIGATWIFWQPSKTPNIAIAENASRPETAPPAPERLSQSRSGIDITVKNITQRDKTTVLSLDLSNHQYDLGQKAIFEKTTLNGKPPTSVTFLSNVSGGHHVEADVEFEKTTSGSFVIAPTEESVFLFDNLW